MGGGGSVEGGIGLLLLSRGRARWNGFECRAETRRGRILPSAPLVSTPRRFTICVSSPPPPAKLISSNGSPPTDYALFQLEHGGNLIILENFSKTRIEVGSIRTGGGGGGRKREIYLSCSII